MPEVPWLGGRRFWAGLVAFAVCCFLALAIRGCSLSSAHAVVPVLTLTGPREALAGESLRYAVLVRDRAGSPLPGAPVRLGFWKNGLVELGRATTGPGGDAAIEITFPADFNESRSLVAVTDAGVAESSDTFEVMPRSIGVGSVFVSTDKPLYQPSQIVHVRALAMANEKPLADRPAVIEIRTGGVKVFHLDKRTTAFGVVAADFPLADQVKLGSYAIDVTVDVDGNMKATGDRRVDVKRYSLPKLKLALEELSALSDDAPLRGKARATWIFGEPVTKGSVVVRLVHSTNERAVTGALDKDGVFRFELSPPPKSKTPGASFKLLADLSAPGGLTATATKDLASLAGGDIKLEAFPESGAFPVGVAQTVYVVATTASKAPITVEAPREAGGAKVKLSPAGIAKLPVVVATQEPGTAITNVKLAAYGEDGSEGKVELEPTTNTLVVRPDKDTYPGGGAAQVRVLGAGVRDRVAVRVTRGDEALTTGSCLVERAEEGCAVAFELPAKAPGLVWIHAVSMPATDAKPSPTVKSGRRLVLVAGGDRDLVVTAAPEKPVHAPGEMGAVDVTVTGSTGAPVKAELGVSVVDEAVFQLADVRPDLEKAFFTVNRDIARARVPYSYGYRYRAGGSTPGIVEAGLPRDYSVAAAYDPKTADDVRATIFAVLTTMPARGGIDASTSSELDKRVTKSLEAAGGRLTTFTISLLTVLAIVLFGGFAIYGLARWVRSPVPAVAGDAVAAFRLESRGLVTDWLFAVVGPPVLGGLSIVFAKILADEGARELVMLEGCWASLAVLCTVFVARGVVRVRRTTVAQELPTLRSALVFLPPAIFFGHLAVLLALGDRGHRLGPTFGDRGWAILPIAVAGAVQLTNGLFSVARQTLLRGVTGKGRLWLFLSRACFLGLPVTLIAAALVLYDVVSDRRHADWRQYAEILAESDYERRGDNKEGGTGARAKGEEGSMGSLRAFGAGAMAAPPAPSATVLGKAEPVRVREDFPETLFWAPSIETDAAGKATVKVPFADSITTWRFALGAVGAGGQLGSTNVPLVVKQDFFVDASLPAVLTQGDEIAVPVTVFSYLSRNQRVTLDLASDGLGVVGNTTTTVDLAPGEARGLRFMVRADKAGERGLTIKATTLGRADAIERKVTIVPNGFKVVRTINGRVVGTATTKAVLPEGAIEGGDDLYVKIYGGPLSQVSEGLDGVFQMPHGCFEQTSSTTYPSVLALDFLKRTKAGSPELEAKARRYIADGYQRLVSFEVPGGGFSLFGKAPAQTALSAYGLMEFADMAKVAVVDEQLLARTSDWLYRTRSPSGGWRSDAKGRDAKVDLRTTAYVAWALAQADRADARLAPTLDLVKNAEGPEASEPYALALRANALLAAGRTGDAAPLLVPLAKAAIRDEAGVHWESREVGVMYSAGPSMAVELTALAAHALAVADRDPELRAGALSWLVAQRGSYGTWSTTPATIAAMRALLDEARPAPKEAQDVSVSVDGAAAESFRLEPAARDVHRLVSLRKAATTGSHEIQIVASGAADVSYQVVVVHYLPWQRQKGAALLSLDVDYQPAAVDVGSVSACRVRLGWRGREPARMPLVEVGIPPAFEVETDELDRLVAKPDARLQRYTVERGRVTLYLDELPDAAPFEIALPLRALRPARVVAPASVAYLYYEPEVRAETMPALLRSRSN